MKKEKEKQYSTDTTINGRSQKGKRNRRRKLMKRERGNVKQNGIRKRITVPAVMEWCLETKSYGRNETWNQSKLIFGQ